MFTHGVGASRQPTQDAHAGEREALESGAGTRPACRHDVDVDGDSYQEQQPSAGRLEPH